MRHHRKPQPVPPDAGEERLETIAISQTRGGGGKVIQQRYQRGTGPWRREKKRPGVESRRGGFSQGDLARPLQKGRGIFLIESLRGGTPKSRERENEGHEGLCGTDVKDEGENCEGEDHWGEKPEWEKTDLGGGGGGLN